VSETGIAQSIFVRKHDGRKVFGKVTVNVIIVLTEAGWKSVECIHLAQDIDQWRGVASMTMNCWIA